MDNLNLFGGNFINEIKTECFEVAKGGARTSAWAQYFGQEMTYTEG